MMIHRKEEIVRILKEAESTGNIREVLRKHNIIVSVRNTETSEVRRL